MSTIAAAFAEANVTGYLHAINIDTEEEVGHSSDELVVSASVFKLPVLVELFRQAYVEGLDIRKPFEVPMPYTLGPTGLSQMYDPITMSLRDLSLLMMSVSDNAATDVICDVVGIDNVNATLRSLGHPLTEILFPCRGIFATMFEDAGVASADEWKGDPTPELVAKLRAGKPAETTRTTPRESARLLAQIWRDEGMPAAACEEVRRVLRAQVWPHRLASGFPELTIKTAGKTGTILGWKNEAGVVEYADGRRYAVATFTLTARLEDIGPAADAAIGKAARAAVEILGG